MQRRHFLSLSTKTAALSTLGSATALWNNWANAEGVSFVGDKTAFSFEKLQAEAKQLSLKAYVPYQGQLPPMLKNMTWDEYQQIQYRPAETLWKDQNRAFTAQFFHLGLYFQTPVHMFQVIDGEAQQIAYTPALFNYGKSGIDAQNLPKDLGFAGFRLFAHDDPTRDVAAFLGASYFRAVDKTKQYGLSARGLAVDTAMSYPEEFPEFVAYYLVRPTSGSNVLTIYGLLDSPSVTGAYRFDLTPGDDFIMDISCVLYPRKEIDRLGIAPNTSMYMTGENDHRMGYDYRPEIHDSDGLQMHTGTGEWIWRPLVNPRNLRFNAFQDEHPQGFGLCQRDHHFDHYQDDGAWYSKRSSLWVEPKGNWGKGSIDLVEIPTIDETFDNIVAFWTPEQKPQAGEELTYAYRLHWNALPPQQSPLARCVDTFTGLGGVVGQKRTYYSKRFVVDFAGSNLANLPEDSKVEAVVTTSRGKVELVSARPLEAIKGYRAMFDLRPLENDESQIDLRLYLAADGKPLSETWLYQWNPPPMDERKLYNS